MRRRGEKGFIDGFCDGLRAARKRDATEQRKNPSATHDYGLSAARTAGAEVAKDSEDELPGNDAEIAGADSRRGRSVGPDGAESFTGLAGSAGGRGTLAYR